MLTIDGSLERSAESARVGHVGGRNLIRHRVEGVAAGLLLLSGGLLPTSSNGNFSQTMFLAVFVVLNGAIALWGLGRLSQQRLSLALPLICLLTAFTLWHFRGDLALNALFGYIGLFGLLVSSRGPDGGGSPKALRLGLLVVSGWQIVLGYGVLAGVDPLKKFMISHYNAYYADLLPDMVGLRKPVGVFATHSVAALGLGLLCLLNAEQYRRGYSRWHLVAGVGMLMLIASLRSSTSLALAPLMAAYLGVAAIRGKHVGARVVMQMILVATMVLVGSRWLSANVNAGGVIGKSLNSRVGGSSAMLTPVVESIERNPLGGVGVASDVKTNVGDNGYFEHAVRMGIPAAVALYALLGARMLGHRESRLLGGAAFIAVLLGEVGFSMTLNVRVLSLLMLVCVWPFHSTTPSTARVGWPMRSAGELTVAPS